MSIVCRTMQSENQNAVREHRRPMETLKKKNAWSGCAPSSTPPCGCVDQCGCAAMRCSIDEKTFGDMPAGRERKEGQIRAKA